MPDVLVDGPALLSESVFSGIPDAVVEVWSPGNTLEEMNAKRREYRASGLPVLVEAFLTDTGGVHLEWLANDGGDHPGPLPLELPGQPASEVMVGVAADPPYHELPVDDLGPFLHANGGAHPRFMGDAALDRGGGTPPR